MRLKPIIVGDFLSHICYPNVEKNLSEKTTCLFLPRRARVIHSKQFQSSEVSAITLIHVIK